MGRTGSWTCRETRGCRAIWIALAVAANLVGNALTHGSEARVEVDGRDPRGVLLRVSNAGRIDDALLPRLFEPFKASFHQSKGLGLGLYIVDQFVRAHGGRIAARNEAGGGVRGNAATTLRRHGLGGNLNASASIPAD